MPTLKIAPSPADLGTVEAMEFTKPVFTFPDFGTEPIGHIRDVQLIKNMKLTCDVKFTEEAWQALQKACSRIAKIHVPEKFPGVRKGEKVTLHFQNAYGDQQVTGILYHVRKPYKDSEDRIYYIREEFSPFSKAA